MKYFQIVATAVKTVFREKRLFFLFTFLTLGALWFFIYIPVKKVPGNTFLFQLSIFTSEDWFLLITLSILTSLSLALNFFVIKRNFNEMIGKPAVSQGGLSLLSGIVGSIFGPTASCASCVGSIFGFLGVGGVFFLLKYRQEIVAFSVLILLLTLYHTSKRVLGICNIKIGRGRF